MAKAFADVVESTDGNYEHNTFTLKLELDWREANALSYIVSIGKVSLGSFITTGQPEEIQAAKKTLMGIMTAIEDAIIEDSKKGEADPQ